MTIYSVSFRFSRGAFRECPALRVFAHGSSSTYQTCQPQSRSNNGCKDHIDLFKFFVVGAVLSIAEESSIFLVLTFSVVTDEAPPNDRRNQEIMQPVVMINEAIPTYDLVIHTSV